MYGSGYPHGDDVGASIRLVLYLWLVVRTLVFDCADFVVLGVDNEQLRWEDEDDAAAWSSAPSILGPAIAEDKLAEAEEGREDVLAVPTPRHVKRNSQNRLSRLSDDARLSLQSIKLVETSGLDSNRSSTTVKGLQVKSSGTGLSDDEFDKALRKFASERDTFLTDMETSSGAVVKPKARPKTQRIVGEEPSNNLKSAMGSIRRRISIRDITSMKRQPSVARQGM